MEEEHFLHYQETVMSRCLKNVVSLPKISFVLWQRIRTKNKREKES